MITVFFIIVWVLCGMIAYYLTKDEDLMFQSFPEAWIYCMGACTVIMFGPLSLFIILFLKCVL